MDKYADNLSKKLKAKRDMQDSVKASEKHTLAEKRLILKGLEKEEEAFYDRYLEIYKSKMKQRHDRLDKAA
jgi:hypothetical protein